MRTDIINYFIKRYKYESYLEIGVYDKQLNFNKIIAKYKIGVDPNVNDIDFKMTSDDFFHQNIQTFDIIFIDGLHESEQVYRDITNSLNFLNSGGTIILHDLNPHNEIIQLVPQTQSGEWTGDCWKAFVRFRKETTEYFTFVIDIDYGVGVIKKSNEKIKPIKILKSLTYENLNKNRINWLNLIKYSDLEDTLNYLEKIK